MTDVCATSLVMIRRIETRPVTINGLFDTFIGLLLAVWSLTGCGHSPITSGSYRQLSTAPDRVVVVGNEPRAVGAALTWLHARGLSAVESPMPWDLWRAEKTIVDQVKRLDAKAIVWIRQTGDPRAPMVSVRGVDVATETVLWNGHARAEDYRSSLGANRIAGVTCHALRAAWGERPQRPIFSKNPCE